MEEALSGLHAARKGHRVILQQKKFSPAVSTLWLDQRTPAAQLMATQLIQEVEEENEGKLVEVQGEKQLFTESAQAVPFSRPHGGLAHLAQCACTCTCCLSPAHQPRVDGSVFGRLQRGSLGSKRRKYSRHDKPQNLSSQKECCCPRTHPPEIPSKFISNQTLSGYIW